MHKNKKSTHYSSLAGNWKKNVQISFYFLISFLRKSGKVYYNPKPLYFRLYDITKVNNCNKMIIVFTEFLLLCSRCCKFASAAYLIWFFYLDFFSFKSSLYSFPQVDGMWFPNDQQTNLILKTKLFVVFSQHSQIQKKQTNKETENYLFL